MRIVSKVSLPVTVAAALAVSSLPVRAERFECLVEPYVEVKLSSAVPGILEQVTVDRGDFVKKGQVLAVLRSDAEKASLDLSRARAEFAARKVERNKELYRKQMISIHERDEMETEAHLLRLEVKEAEERLKLRSIVSPIDGVVVKRSYTAGEYVEELPVLELAQIDPLRVEAVVPTRFYRKVRVGMTGQVEWESPLGGTNAATVTIVDPVVDAASGTIGVRLELPNASRRLAAGAKCMVSFPIADDAPAGR
ncbi:MAG TPA: efflux RND transporter periplasmic adaptor subunit [Candidatus Polarisedimenticolia bacterium]|nr:efflux RND transporter periplasmic adaptor subunit [Candidatus Polarisedimenticolia bacterium]